MTHDECAECRDVAGTSCSRLMEKAVYFHTLRTRVCINGSEWAVSSAKESGNCVYVVVS